MYKLLIVDDEPFILEGLAELFRENTQMEIYKAYSGSSALALLDKQRVDIVLTDIQMPGINGIDLLKDIHLRWPFCKVIILTAYSEFSYVQQALNNHVAGYVLKTDGDEAILRTVQQCIEKIQQEMRQSLFLEETKRQAEAALPLLQNASLLNILEWMTKEQARKELEIYKINLDINKPLALAAVHIDRFEQEANSQDKFNIMLQLVEIFKKYISPRYICYHASFHDKNMIWLLQAQNGNDSLLYLKESLEMVQEHSMQGLGVSISIIYNEFITWDKIHNCFNSLKMVFNQMVVNNNNMVLADMKFYSGGKGNSLYTQSEIIINKNRQLELLKFSLEHGDFNGFKMALGHLLNNEEKSASLELELYHTISQLMLSYINDYGLSEAMMTTPEIFNTFYTYCSKEDMYDRLLHIARRIFEVRMKSKNRHDNSIIKKIQRYIVSNLSGDLSLETIGDIFYMNPAYMSRLYKQTTGQNISDYITKKRMELANKLLLHSEMKIYIIAKEVGYASPAYFNRIFKKIESVTPQEYREKHKILS